jgi:hypothetical protein
MPSPYKDADMVESTKHRKFINNTAANGTDTLEVYETEVYIDNDSTYTETLTLPPVCAAKGRSYAIRTVDTGGHTTIQDQDDSLEWTDLVTDADNEYVLLYSDGRQWFNLATDIS